MGISYCLAGVAYEETQFILQLVIPNKLREVQKCDRQLQVRERILEDKTG
jgi:hypothetical protein